MSYTIIDRDVLPRDDNTYEFEGVHYQIRRFHLSGLIRLHKYPYREIFIIQEGVSTFTVGSVMVEAHAGQILIVPADTPHKLMNLSDTRLKQVDIHVSKQCITHWLED